MKTIALLAFAVLPFFVLAQVPDSAAIRQVDSPLEISRALTGQGDFDKALEVNATAEKLALEKLGQRLRTAETCRYKGSSLETLTSTSGFTFLPRRVIIFVWFQRKPLDLMVSAGL